MTRRTRSALSFPRATALAMALGLGLAATAAHAVNYPITDKQRSTAQQVAQDGVPLSELAPNAPDSYTVKKGDTLWDISSMFLKSPWRWPELWGMNLDQIRNPHLIYPGQVLFLDKSNGRARLRVGQELGPDGSGRLSPRVRVGDLNNGGIPSITMAQIEPFLNEAVIFEEGELAQAPRIVAAQDGRVLLTRGDLAYVRGDLKGARSFRIFREPRPLRDPSTQEVLGYEGHYLGVADFTRKGETVEPGKTGEIIPDTFTITSVRQEVRAGDRLTPVPSRDFYNFVPHAPQSAMSGQIVSVYGEAVTAGQNQIVVLNRGRRDGMEAGHVLALWRNGARVIDKTDPARPTVKLPDEKHGHLFVFRVFDRMSYALILSVNEPVTTGDRFTQP
jgi:hypothetical protein